MHHNQKETTSFVINGLRCNYRIGVIENDADLQIGKIFWFMEQVMRLNIIQATKLRSAKKIIAVDLYDNKLSLQRA